MTHTVPSKAVAHGPGEGEVLPFLGITATIKGPGIIELVAPHGWGSPLHVHHREDEWFYVLEGELTIWVDGETYVAPAGACALGPADLDHTFVVSSEEGARFLFIMQPGGFEEFVRAVSGDEIPSPEQLTEIAARYGVDILGPPGIPG